VTKLAHRPDAAWLLERVVFDGSTCAAIADEVGLSAAWVRSTTACELLRLRAAMTSDRAGAADELLERMLVLRAAGALDPDEEAVVDRAIAGDPELASRCDDYRALVGDLCTTAVIEIPPPRVLARILCSIEDDLAIN
jgi:hypothetical protein